MCGRTTGRWVIALPRIALPLSLSNESIESVSQVICRHHHAEMHYAASESFWSPPTAWLWTSLKASRCVCFYPSSVLVFACSRWLVLSVVQYLSTNLYLNPKGAVRSVEKGHWSHICVKLRLNKSQTSCRIKLWGSASCALHVVTFMCVFAAGLMEFQTGDWGGLR